MVYKNKIILNIGRNVLKTKLSLYIFKLQILYYKIFYHTYYNIINSIVNWWYWYSPPWNKTVRCSQCAGTGHYTSESDSRYGDFIYKCSMCRGSGRTLK